MLHATWNLDPISFETCPRPAQLLPKRASGPGHRQTGTKLNGIHFPDGGFYSSGIGLNEREFILDFSEMLLMLRCFRLKFSPVVWTFSLFDWSDQLQRVFTYCFPGQPQNHWEHENSKSADTCTTCMYILKNKDSHGFFARKNWNCLRLRKQFTASSLYLISAQNEDHWTTYSDTHQTSLQNTWRPTTAI